MPADASVAASGRGAQLGGKLCRPPRDQNLKTEADGIKGEQNSHHGYGAQSRTMP